LGLVSGQGVNLRVGPRTDGHPVARLDEGTVVLVVEEVGDWLGVRVPQGFPAAVARRYLEPAGPDALRVTADRLNLRVRPPKDDGPMPDPFRDQIGRGCPLPHLRDEGDWAWVIAPEEVRAYLHKDYVHVLGPFEEHEDALKTARARRVAEVEALARARREEEALEAGGRLRGAVGETQAALWRLREEGGIDRTPVVDLANALDGALAQGGAAPPDVRRLARALRQDLENELEIRTARKDAEVARIKGETPPTEPKEAPVVPMAEVRGTIRWEAAPRWRNGGAFVLWRGEEPVHVLELTTGTPLPLPDLAGLASSGEEALVKGAQPGRRVFGLPVIEVHAATKAP